MYGSTYAALLQASSHATLLRLEASNPIGLRLADRATGRLAGAAEVSLMAGEKLQVGIKLRAPRLAEMCGTAPLSGPQATILHYVPRVVANDQRLKPRWW